MVPGSRSFCGQECGSASGTQPRGSPVAVWGYKMLFAFSRSKELKMNKPVKLAVTAVFALLPTPTKPLGLLLWLAV